MGVDDDSCIDGSKKMTPFQSLVRDRGISLKEISEATGIGYSTLGNYNQGSRSPNANKPNATISIELVKELYSIREKRLSLHQEYIELDKKEKDILERIRSAVL